jgi:hypothetical protein
MKFNKLEVIEVLKHQNRLMYRVKCDCGSVELKRADHVKNGRAKMCKSCSSKLTASRYPMPVHRTGFGNLSGTHVIAIKHGALRRGLEFSLEAKYLWELYTKQKGLCAITGVPITLSLDLKDHNVNWDVITASLDRIDNSIGYVQGNVWWVHKEINRLKNNYSMQELVYWATLIVERYGNPERSSENENIVSENVQRLEGEDSTNNPSTNAQPRYSFTYTAGEDIV